MQFVDFKAEAKEYSDQYTEAFTRTLDSGWYILGKEVESFESEFAQYLGAKHVIGVSNGLEAIQISLMALGISAGDEVITTPMSAIATTLAIIAVGAKPIFVDTKEDGQINEALIEAVITPKTRAILPVHLYGNSCSIELIKEIAKKHNLGLVEDAAQAHGSMYKSQMLGTIGDLGCFSFYPTKNLGAVGDAGCISTNSDELATKCRQIRDYGQAKKYQHVIYGLNSRLDELQASLLREKLKHLNELNERRTHNAKIYFERLDPNHVNIIKPLPSTKTNYHQLVIKVKQRDKLQAHLSGMGIPTLIHYPILIPDQPLFDNKYSKLDLPVARRLVTEILSIPCGPYLTKIEVEEISKTINSFSWA